MSQEGGIDEIDFSECYMFEKTDMDVIVNPQIENEEKFYGDGAEYWEKIPATVNGMLGGYAKISPTDIMGSENFLRQYYKDLQMDMGKERALDCGAGIGRITKRLLLPLFDKVDMVEQCQTFLDQASDFIGPDISRVTLICSGLQDVIPTPNAYNLIWIQWVTGHLTDEHFVQFLQRCRVGLKQDGLIVIKENTTSSNKTEFDRIDSSLTRNLFDIKSLIQDAGMTVVKCEKQKDFPKTLYSVYMIAFR